MSLFFREGMLTGTEIARQVKKGNITISPYDPTCINPNSYNLKLHPQLLIYARDSERANIVPKKEDIPCSGQDIRYTHNSESGLIETDRITPIVSEIGPTDSQLMAERVVEQAPQVLTSSNEGLEYIIKNNRAAVATIDEKMTDLKSDIQDQFDSLDSRLEDAFNQLGGIVESNDKKSRERDQEIKNIPAVESNYLPPIDMHMRNETIEFEIPKEGYVLQPGVLYIGRTIERTATDKFIPMINGRSSGGRLGISIHICAGFGDIGFDGTWTLEITVVEPVRIYPNEEIAQVCFFTPAGKKPKLYRGRYYNQEDATASKFYQPKKEY